MSRRTNGVSAYCGGTSTSLMSMGRCGSRFHARWVAPKVMRAKNGWPGFRSFQSLPMKSSAFVSGRKLQSVFELISAVK